MGVPEGLTELHIPRYVFKTLYVITFFRDILDALCPYIGLPRFLNHHTSPPDPTTTRSSENLACELIPVIRFSDLKTNPEDCCTVCLSDFESDDPIMQLPDCLHVFHHRCLDRWIVDCHQMTCPICRNRFLPNQNYMDSDSYSGLGSVWFMDELESRTNY